MPTLRFISLSLLSKISGNRVIQSLLQKNVIVSQFLQGIGSGTGVLTSGEKRIFDVLAQHYQPPFCIFDVGANKGQFLNFAVECLQSNDYTIHCFEPSHTTFRILSQHSPIGDKRIILNNMGLGREQGQMTLHYDTPGSELASLTKRKLAHFRIDFDESETVKIDTVDNYCLLNQIERIHLLKIDVEGHELDVLAGAKCMFDKRAVDIATFEFGGCNIDTRTFFQDFWHFFSSAHMKLYRITPSGYLSAIDSYREVDEQFRTTNFIAIKLLI